MFMRSNASITSARVAHVSLKNRRLASRRAAERAFSQAGLAPPDVDVCEFYDPFSFEIIRQLEAFGFCKEGEGGDFVMDGRIRIDGELPVATNGGTL